MPRRKPLRLKHYDYSEPGFYFVTACTCGRQHLFGQIVNGAMQLNEMGKIVHNEWIKTIRSNVELDEFIIMPNHFHGIVQLGNKFGETGSRFYF